MNKIKYLFKTITNVCKRCKGYGYWDETVDISPCNFNCNCDERVTCPDCKGKGIIRITSKAKDFKKYYIKELERIINMYNIRLSDVRQIESSVMKDIKKYNKELDKFINKKDGRK